LSRRLRFIYGLRGVVMTIWRVGSGWGFMTGCGIWIGCGFRRARAMSMR
jgi:hypothetical protein